MKLFDPKILGGILFSVSMYAFLYYPKNTGIEITREHIKLCEMKQSPKKEPKEQPSRKDTVRVVNVPKTRNKVKQRIDSSKIKPVSKKYDEVNTIKPEEEIPFITVEELTPTQKIRVDITRSVLKDMNIGTDKCKLIGLRYAVFGTTRYDLIEVRLNDVYDNMWEITKNLYRANGGDIHSLPHGAVVISNKSIYIYLKRKDNAN